MLTRSQRAMNVEMLDGFLAALVCSPDMVRASEYLRVIGAAITSAVRWGSEMKRRRRSSSISSCGTGTRWRERSTPVSPTCRSFSKTAADSPAPMIGRGGSSKAWTFGAATGPA
ncbi:MAG: YecA family protein [Akkermansiaceae bacterium]|nr:YecA family protein [Akkermansiaceae bacterium]